MDKQDTTALTALCFAATALFAIVVATGARAHQIPGHDHNISYPSGCCNSAATSPNGDCAPIDDQYVTEEADGYHVNLPKGAHPKLLTKGFSGVIPYSKVKNPLDEKPHICLSTDGAVLYCFFPKPMGS